MIDYKSVADAENMIINGYAFTKDGENIKVLNLNNPDMAVVLDNVCILHRIVQSNVCMFMRVTGNLQKGDRLNFL